MESPERSENNETAPVPDELRSAMALVGRPEGPPRIGEFEIDEQGRLRARADGAPLAFGFSYRGVDFVTEVQTGAETCIRLSAELGKLPYRAEAGERRDLTRRIVDATRHLPHGRLTLSIEQDILLTAEVPAPAPLTPAGLMAALAAALLDFRPYIDLLSEVMFAPEAKTG